MKKNFTKHFWVYFVLFLISPIVANAQATIGSALTPNTGALLDLKENADGSSNKGLGMPRISLKSLTIDVAGGETNMARTLDGTTTADIWDRNEHIGLLVYNVNTVENQTNRICPGMHVWDGEFWQPIASYAAPIEVKELDNTQPIVRGFQYLDPSVSDGWSLDKQADRLAGKYNLGHNTTNNTPDLQDTRGTESRRYTTSRFYVGYKTITRSYVVKRNNSCDPVSNPAWTSIENITETERVFTDGIWMTQHLNTTKMPDGTDILQFSESMPVGTPHYQMLSGDPSNLYGLLYNWYASINVGSGAGQTPNPGDANQAGSNQSDVNIQGICPSGWHLPSDQEWTDLENGIIRKTSVFSNVPDLGEAKMIGYDDMDWRGIDGLGRAMKSKTALAGKVATRGESNTALLGGFDAYLTGHYNADISNPTYKENNVYFWSASSFGATDGMRRSLYTEINSQAIHGGAHRAWSARVDLFSVRCKKN